MRTQIRLHADDYERAYDEHGYDLNTKDFDQQLGLEFQGFEFNIFVFEIVDAHRWMMALMKHEFTVIHKSI